MSELTLTPLGTGGFFPGRGRHTACYLLTSAKAPDRAVLLDAGTGVARLAFPKIRRMLAGVKELHVVLTHYHLDHVCGLFYLTMSGLPDRIVVHAPVRPLVDYGLEDGVPALLTPPFHPWARHADLEVRPFSEGETEAGGLVLSLRRQEHPGGSVGIRVGRSLAYVTDTVADPAAAEFASGVGLLLHDAWCLTEEEAAAPEHDGVEAGRKHASVPLLAGMVREARVGALALVHLPPWKTAAEVADAARRVQEKAGVRCLTLREGAPYAV